MKRETVRGIVALAVLLVLYILIAFLVPFFHTATFWLSFVFTLVGFGVVAVSIYIAFVKNPDAKSRFYGFPIAKIGVIYGIVQLVAGLVFMALAAFAPAWLAVLIFAIALAAAIIGLVSADAVLEEIEKQDERLKKDVSLMRSLQSKVNQMAVQSEDGDIKALSEEFRYSDPVSNYAIADVEAELAAVVDELQAAYIDGDNEAAAKLCRRASALLSERNRLCKLNKANH